MAGFDFGAAASELVRRFRIVNDTVMGGRSSSSLRVSGTGAFAVFSGTISLDGGGFAGCMAAVDPPFMLAAEGVCATVRGDGQRYKVVLQKAGGGRRGDGVSYQHDFVAGDEWRAVRLPFTAFRASWRGQSVSADQAGALHPANIAQLGLRLSLLTDSGTPNRTLREGDFRLDVKSVVPY